jgi:hypothetical protein
VSFNNCNNNNNNNNNKNNDGGTVIESVKSVVVNSDSGDVVPVVDFSGM